MLLNIHLIQQVTVVLSGRNMPGFQADYTDTQSPARFDLKSG